MFNNTLILTLKIMKSTFVAALIGAIANAGTTAEWKQRSVY